MPRPRLDTSGTLLLVEDWPESTDLTALFGNDHPVELDIGCGKGLFLLQEGRRRPEANFLGVDWALKYARRAAERLVKYEVSNARVVAGDIWKMLPTMADASIAAIHVYFPDPWWKRRHRKRRLFSSTFLDTAARLLRDDSRLHVATDVEEYFGVMMKELERHELFVPAESPVTPAPEEDGDADYLTHFERKYRLEGRAIHRTIYKRLGR
ncbi:tRNA (guanine-N(7)-)-methyltransferase [Planctomycetes bacterium Pan216]|uniref:tRNA (guanine-N(7)-)-methyltransferase n=1 Tax=Kolteria novifilia TaxID=2527975 RepID=A0A518B6Z3_9BACT|nr:tRNA (guanine-N(7)-)-methyltransferase [Planctomycetes bacterium Pan216]